MIARPTGRLLRTAAVGLNTWLLQTARIVHKDLLAPAQHIPVVTCIEAKTDSIKAAVMSSVAYLAGSDVSTPTNFEVVSDPNRFWVGEFTSGLPARVLDRHGQSVFANLTEGV